MLEQFVLPPGRLDDVRVAMSDADRHDTAKRVEITPPLIVPDILHLSFHEHDRFLVVEENSRIQKLLAQAQDLVGGRALVGDGLMLKWRKLKRVHVWIICRAFL